MGKLPDELRIGRGTFDKRPIVTEHMEKLLEKSVGLEGIDQVGQESRHPSLRQHGVREESNRMPFAIAIQSPFRKDHVNMRIPFEITAKGVKTAYHAGFEAKGMVSFIEPVGDGLSGRLKQDVEEFPILSEIGAKLLCNGKDDMPMLAVKQLGRDGLGSFGLISNTAGITEPGMASEWKDFVSTAMGAAVHGEAIGRIAA